MEFDPPLIRARLVRRYKRFLADVILEDGRKVTAHCANPGAMTGVNTPGATVWLQPNSDPKRKLKYSWKVLELPGGYMVGIDTSLPNRLVRDALERREIPELTRYENIRAEVKYSENSRVDFLLTAPDLPDCYLEVKNVHLCRQDRIAEFPDCVTKRGAKHMHDLAAMKQAGHRAVLLYVVQRDDCTSFQLARDLDPGYAAACDHAFTQGVETLCHGCSISTSRIRLAGPLPFERQSTKI